VKTDEQKHLEEKRKEMERQLYKEMEKLEGEVDLDNVYKGERIRDIASQDINKYQLNNMEDTYKKVNEKSKEEGIKLWEGQLKQFDNVKTDYHKKNGKIINNSKRTHISNDEMQICTKTLEALKKIGSDIAVISWAAYLVNELWINVRKSWEAAVLSDENAKTAKKIVEDWEIDVHDTTLAQLGAEIGLFATRDDAKTREREASEAAVAARAIVPAARAREAAVKAAAMAEARAAEARKKAKEAKEELEDAYGEAALAMMEAVEEAKKEAEARKQAIQDAKQAVVEAAAAAHMTMWLMTNTQKTMENWMRLKSRIR